MIRGIRPHQSGFTILETIIVLAVTIGLMTIAFTLFRSKVPRTQFASSINELDEKIRNTANDVTNGYYPNTNSATCNGTTAGFDTGTSTEQGANQDCIFLGKAIQFGYSDGTTCNAGSPNDKCDTLKIYTIYGNRLNSVTNKVSTNLADADAKFIGSAAANSGNSAPEVYKMGYGTYVTKVVSGGDNLMGGVAFTQTFGSTVSSSGEPSGSPQVQLLPIKTGGIGQDEDTFITNGQSFIVAPTAIPNPPGGVVICLRSAGSNQFAIVTVGESQRTNATKVEIFEKQADLGSRCS